MINIERLSRDIGLFSDPATELDVVEESGRIVIRLVRSGEDREYFFKGQKGIEARHNGKQFSSLASLLSSE